MSSPVELSDLPVANLTLANDPSAIMLLRVGLTDYQVAVSIIRNINLQALQTLPNGTPIQTDVMLVNRVVSGTPTNFQVTFGSVGFPAETKMWFYNTTPPSPNWAIVAGTGDKLLGCQDNTSNYAAATAGSTGGTWQQTDYALLASQIPPHTHGVAVSEGGTVHPDARPKAQSANATRVYASMDSFENTGGGGGHNHGATWRPLANVGIIGVKKF